MGHKRALIVGINYIGTPDELKGCINDSNNINSLITNKFGFEDVRMLQEQQATTDNIKEGLKWLVSGCRPGDVLFFHYSGHGCFSGDTKIKLLDGTEKSLEELVDLYPSTPFWVYSIDNTGNVVPGKAHSPRMTKISNVVEIKLDNGEVIRCTPDHKFMLRNGEYCEAQYLVPETSLMPLYTRISSYEENDRLDGYEKVYIPKYDNWVYTHQMVGYRSGIVENMHYRGGVLHHKNFNKLDNTPENLQFMTKSDHAQLHSHTEERREIARKNRVDWNKNKWPEYFKQNKILQEQFKTKSTERKKQLWLDEEYQQRYYDGVSNYWNNLTEEERQYRSFLGKSAIEKTRSPEVRARAGSSIKRTLALKSQKQKNIAKQKRKETLTNQCYNDKATITQLLLSKDIAITESISALIDSYPINRDKNHNRWHITNKKQNECVFCFLEANNIAYPANHKVVSVTITKEVIPVFDITVDEYHNFALSSGVFVHNSQVADTSDPDVEPDYVDEIICPIDINWKDKIITDDYMKWIFDPVPAGVNLLVFLDCCHSGSGLDQANQYQPVAPDTKSIESGGRFLPPPSNVQALIDKLQLQPKPRVVQTRTVDDTGVLLAACGASQTSADAYIYQQYQGAGTFSFIYSLEGRKYNGTYIDVVDDMAKFMVVNKYSQRPELNGAPSAMSLKVLIPADVTQETLNNYEPPDATPAPNTTQSALIQSVFKMNTLTLISTVVGIGLILYGLISLLR